MATDRQRGFTLIEMMVALAILLVGVTSLLAALAGAVDLRRSSEAQAEAGRVADQALLAVQQQIRRQPGDDALALQLPQLLDQPVPALPGMSYSVRYTREPDRFDVVLVEIDVRWREQGEDMRQRFHRLLPLQEPLGVRAARFLDDNPDSEVQR